MFYMNPSTVGQIAKLSVAISARLSSICTPIVKVISEVISAVFREWEKPYPGRKWVVGPIHQVAPLSLELDCVIF